MKLLTLHEAEKSNDIDVKLVAVRASKYRVFGSPARIQDSEIAVVDLRDGVSPSDFESRFQVLERHPMQPLMLVRKLGQ
ncbi:MAG TPA: hypothetical protein VG778_04195 [Blastocatellia bacterium]|nr:hypothetical protein [Blastocatellia bacterium]